MSNKKSTCASCGDSISGSIATGEFLPTLEQTVSKCGKCSKVHTYTPKNTSCISDCLSYNEMPTIVPPRATACGTRTDLFARVDKSFSYPAAGSAVEVQITNVALTEGQPLTSEKYGTLYVFAILDEKCGVYELENRGDTDVDLVGKQVPAGVEFWTGSGGTGSIPSSSSCTELTKDFRIPAVGLTGVAEVSSLAEFQANSPAIIRLKANTAIAYRFTVVSTIGTSQVELRNDGQGGPVGTYITADSDCDGSLDWCIEPLEGGSICEQASVATGLPFILGCDGGTGVLKIAGNTDKQVLAWDDEQDHFALFQIPDLAACVNLTSCFQVAPWAGCAAIPVYITTSDDQLLLDRAEAALLSGFADPRVTICGDDFSVDVEASSVGSIVILPTFNPVAVKMYDENCQVCVPPDCCFQCNPQVEPPVEDYTFSGKFVGGAPKLPAGILAVQGSNEYKFRIVTDPVLNALATNQYNSANNAYMQTYNTNGAVYVPSTPADSLVLDRVQYCNDGPCPLLITHGVDLTLDVLGMIANLEFSFNLRSLVTVYNCNDIDGTQIRPTQHQILFPFKGPTRTSTTSLGADRSWGVGTPATKTFSAQSGEAERSIEVYPGECFVAITELTLLVYVGTTVPNEIAIALNSNIRVRSQII